MNAREILAKSEAKLKEVFNDSENPDLLVIYGKRAKVRVFDHSTNFFVDDTLQKRPQTRCSVVLEKNIIDKVPYISMTVTLNDELFVINSVEGKESSSPTYTLNLDKPTP